MKQTPSRREKEMQTARELPELTNSDLEFLFTQLLEGVYQGREQHWAKRWLQNIEHRVSQQRWLEWLQDFGNKILASSAPNHELASRMVDLGELEIGEIGDVAYDIGIQLLTRNAKQQTVYSIPISTEFEGLTGESRSAQAQPLQGGVPLSSGSSISQELIIQPIAANGEDDFDVQSEELIIESIATNGQFETTSLEDSPGQELIREFGELLWENYEPSSNAIAPANTAEHRILSSQEFPEALYEQIFEYEEELDEPEVPAENTNKTGFEEELEQEVTPGQDLVSNLGELLWKEEETGQNNDKSSVNASEQEFINDLSDLVWDYPEQNQEDTILAPVPDAVEDQPLDTTKVPIQDSVEDEEDETFNALLELAEEVEEDDDDVVVEAEFLDSTTLSTTSTTSVEPTVTTAIDQLLVRLGESANLVQQLASGLEEGRWSVSQVTDEDQVVEDDSAAQAAEAWFYQGLSQARAGNLELAIELYEKAVQTKPDVHEYWFNRGLTLFHLGQLEDAIASYDQAIEIKNDFYKGWYNRGRALGELGFFEEAIVSFNTAIQIKPNYQEAWSSNGLALLKLGRVDQAIFSYDKSLELEPLDPENWYYRGVALSNNARYEDAIDSYNKALELEPYLHDAWVDKGVAESQLGQWNQAIASWDEALKIRPDFYLTWFNRAVALDNLGSREEAVTSYDKALEIEPNFHLAWYNRAVALFYIEQYEQAILCYDRALEIKADYWEAWLGRGSAAEKSQNFDSQLSLSSPVAQSNSALNARGEQGKLASYLEALKYVSDNTQPEGWGRLHLAIGNCYYDIGKRYSTPRDYWYEAVDEYNQALVTITADDFPELHLEVLQNFIKVLVGLRETKQAQELHQYSTDLLQELLTQPNRSDENRKQLTLKNIGFEQLAVEIAIQYGEIVQGLEIAEHGKNACLTWLLYGWTDKINSPNYKSILQLLNPTTAAIYWHISPSSLRTFIIKPNAPEPIPVFTPVLNVAPDEYPLPEAINRLVEFADWLEEWNREYADYRSENRDKQSKVNHFWRRDMERRMAQLREILCIGSIEQELQGISNIILIPHRDLHKFPLHGLFSAKFAISYLPSLQIGLNLQQQKHSTNKSSPKLLSVEHPDTKDYPPFKSAKLAALAISQLFHNPHRIQGIEATKPQVENALAGNYNIFNFYGYANDKANSSISEILLAWEDKITLDQICKKPLHRYNLFTLSACEIAVNKQQITTEYAGLTSGLLSQGVKHVVSSLWRVESTANALVIIEFYRRLQSGKTSVIALKEAVEWLKELTAGELTKWYENLLNQLPPEGLRMKAQLATQLYRTSQMEADTKLYSHPYYWAAFVIGGVSN
ncbi:CHAT domain-containing protein [Plectonema radiosum]|nr:tetratricopeptide repeat protein [Plectonema radiosum]